ncbi:MAG: xanthine phosphoribosyltransferase [Clostridia bacterium]|nr:xanthine phosphoribosyltransferase [Clostridia bacterium]MBQ2135338.1 xanthine phosphoribosyltransferase [Clostridia bacterium]MBQ2237078.1 xanthine phosphoribosyltransferase [Clostridia bacterium]MEE1184520.1 xanthine phosphoribosyltransferase [Acutalibacteraceae bacterium]
MKALEEKILKEGTVLPGNILKVASFLNHKLDVDFIMEMGKEIARIFADEKITKILTVETSGIAIAMGAAAAMHVPVVFAKKHKSGNLSGQMYKTVVHSYTHGVDYTIVVSCEFLDENDKILIVDDFLANGKALNGLIDIVGQAGATVVGCSCAIEKGFQGGGDALREQGIRVESLAIVEQMSDDSLTFRSM